MVININKNGVKQVNQGSQNQLPLKYGAWGTVMDVNSELNAVDVKLANGLILKDVPVASTDEWVCDFEDDNYISGSRNLPPQNTRVFLLMPTGTYEGAFVLCSGLSMFEKKHKSKFMADKQNRDEKNIIRKKVYPGKWIEKYNYKTGQWELQSPNENIKINIQDDKDTQQVNVEANGAIVKIDKDGNVEVKAKGNSTLKLNGDNFSGVVKIDDLTNKLNRLENKVNDIIAKYNSHTHLLNGTAGAPPVGPLPITGAAMATTSTATPISPVTSKKDLENNKVLHGG